MSIEKTLAISLGSNKLGDTSRIVTFLTSDFGLIKCVAKGSRSKKSKFGAALEPCNMSSIVFYYKPNRELFTLGNADLAAFFPKIRSDLLKTAYAQIPLDLLKHAILPLGHSSDMFAPVKEFLEDLEISDQVGVYAQLFVRFLIKFSENLGFKIQAEKCRLCGKSDTPYMLFLIPRGWVYCSECGKAKSETKKISQNAFRILEGSKPAEMQKDTPRSAQKELVNVLTEYLSYHLGKPLNLPSMEFMRSLER